MLLDVSTLLSHAGIQLAYDEFGNTQEGISQCAKTSTMYRRQV